MTTALKRAERTRRFSENPNHHLWRQGSHWWVYCAVRPTHTTKDKLRRSLDTACEQTARRRRDLLFNLLALEGFLAPLHQRHHLDIAPPPRSHPMQPWRERVEAIMATVVSTIPELQPHTPTAEPKLAKANRR
jgi:hypothetical protein